MKILWSLPVFGETLNSSRGDLVRAKNLVGALRDIGHDVHVINFGAAAAVSAYRQVLRRMLPRLPALIIRDAGRWLASFGQARIIEAHLNRWGADVIVETQVGFLFPGALAAEKTGRLLILDDCSPSREEKLLGAALHRLAGNAMRRQARTAAAIIVTSHGIAESLRQEGVPQEKIRLLANGVNLKAYERTDRHKARRRMGIAEYCVVGFAGSFQPWHATARLVEALHMLRDNSGWHMLLVGNGPALEPTLQAARRLGLEKRITTTGAVFPDRAPELIACFDIGVLPGSNDYGHPMKLVEYAASGVASVAPDLPPVREVIQDMKTGLLFTPGRVDELAHKLQMLLCDERLRRQMAERARRSVTGRNDWRSLARELAAMIEPLLAKSRHY